MAGQASFDDLGTPLHEVAFVVVDLETTGLDPAGDAITEIGAVRVQGGEVVAELATLVDPERGVPPAITLITGITDAMVHGAPRIAAVLPSFLEMARGAVLVAHNARFDVGFLRAAAAASAVPWPAFPVVDTVRLARATLSRDEVPDHRLSTLARVLGARTDPTHRALADARATVDVLHALLERLGSQGVRTLEELIGHIRAVPDARRRKRHLAADLPDAPGVYLFRDAQDEVLYVGRSKKVRSRVRSYFTAAETRPRMTEMVGLAERVEAVVCATEIEAAVREVRLIHGHRPRYNRRSRHPERLTWLTMSDERFPRLVLSRGRRDGAAWVGPYGSREAAQLAAEALSGTFRLRTCTQRLTRTAAQAGCALAEMGRCLAPCRDGTTSGGAYAEAVDAAVAAMTEDPSPVVAALAARMAVLAGQDRFEEAATIRDRSAALVAGVRRRQRLDRLTSCAVLVAAARRPTQGWDVVAIANGRLRATTVLPPRQAPAPYLEALTTLATTAPEPEDPSEATAVEEIELLMTWLERPGTRLIEVDGTWACPVTSAERLPDHPGSAGATLHAAASPPAAPAASRLTLAAGDVPAIADGDDAGTRPPGPPPLPVPAQAAVPAHPTMTAGRL